MCPKNPKYTHPNRKIQNTHTQPEKYKTHAPNQKNTNNTHTQTDLYFSVWVGVVCIFLIGCVCFVFFCLGVCVFYFRKIQNTHTQTEKYKTHTPNQKNKKNTHWVCVFFVFFWLGVCVLYYSV
jgi:heme/copper-type cytochrome/quinol oxidase subunit 2